MLLKSSYELYLTKFRFNDSKVKKENPRLKPSFSIRSKRLKVWISIMDLATVFGYDNRTSFYVITCAKITIIGSWRYQVEKKLYFLAFWTQKTTSYRTYICISGIEFNLSIGFRIQTCWFHGLQETHTYTIQFIEKTRILKVWLSIILPVLKFALSGRFSLKTVLKKNNVDILSDWVLN